MELSNDMLIDLGLNLTGFLAAAGLMFVGRSIISRTNKPIEASTETASVTLQTSTSNTTNLKQEPMDVISFGGGNQESHVPTTEQRRNRAEVIRLARQMLASGTSTDRIRSLLPLSEAEMAVLSYER